MKVQLDRSFALPVPAERAWVLLQDIEKVAGCMPGARITERSGDRNYKGTVAVKFGPASMSFRGDVEVLALEPEKRTLRLVGKGTDSTGTSAASMDLTANLLATDVNHCSLVGHSEVSMSGKAAAFGARMIDSVAEQILKQFAANFATQLQALPDSVATVSASSTAASVNTATRADAPEPKPLNGIALLWAVARDWLRSLVAAKKA